MYSKKRKVASQRSTLLFLLILLLCVGGFIFSEQAFSQESEKGIAKNLKKPVDQKKKRSGVKENKAANWGLLLFTNKRKILKVHFQLLDMKSSPWKKSGIAGESGMDVETDDPLVLKVFQEGLNMPLRHGVPEEGFGAGGTNYEVGTIKVTTNEDQFIIGITSSGFTLGSKHYTIQNVFYSWILAKQIDDLLFEKEKRHLIEEVFEILSGENIINDKRFMYYHLRGEKNDFYRHPR